MHSGRWAAAAHLFRPKLSPNLKMLSSARHRAGRFDVGRLPTGLLRSPRSEFSVTGSWSRSAAKLRDLR
eukprot:4438258-Prymnesium_polylepis.1